MEKIYSKAKPGTLLHIINQRKEITNKRQNLSLDEQFLQVACYELEKNQEVDSHKHLEQIRTTYRTQESWIVLQGAVKIKLYDLDDKIIKEAVLKPGDCSITFEGGHSFKCLENNTLFYEIKNGPYMGIEKDKQPIGDE